MAPLNFGCTLKCHPISSLFKCALLSEYGEGEGVELLRLDGTGAKSEIVVMGGNIKTTNHCMF